MNAVFIPQVQYELSRLQKRLEVYAELSERTEKEIIGKKSKDVGLEIMKALRALKPIKGSIKAAQLSALKAGRGLHVRSAVYRAVGEKYQALTSVATGRTYLANIRGGNVRAYSTTITTKDGKQLNLQALAVQRELTIRESGRGFAAFSVPRPVGVPQSNYDREIESKYGFTLSEFTANLSAETKYAVLRWFRRSVDSFEDAVKGLSKPVQQAAFVRGLQNAIKDIDEYIRAKIGDDLSKAGLT